MEMDVFYKISFLSAFLKEALALRVLNEIAQK